MSTTLWWRPCQTLHTALDDDLKHVLGKQGKLNACRYVADNTQRLYFEGLRDAGVTGARDILDALERHQTIELWVE